MWHAPTYNEGSKNDWYMNHLHRIYQKTYSAEVSENADSVVIDTKIALGGAANPPIIKMNVIYTFTTDGAVKVDVKGEIRETAPILPRLGLEIILPEDNESVTYFGLGETETYPDRYKAARYGEYSLNVNDDFVHYVRPQENSNHFKTRRVAIGKENGTGLFVTGTGTAKEFSFHASHISAEQLTEVKHDFELEKEPRTIFNIDGRFNAISEDSQLDNDENNRRFDEKQVDFGFVIKPVKM